MSRLPFIVLGLLLWLPALAEPQGDSGPPADILAVRNIEIIFHTAGSVLPNKDLDLMMSLYADDAVLTDTAHDNKVYQGKEQVRTYWANVSGPFRRASLDWLHAGNANQEQRHGKHWHARLRMPMDERGRQYHWRTRFLFHGTGAREGALAG
jgi:hypothetical protein